MKITQQDSVAGIRKPTVSRNTSLGREFHRSATWQDGDDTTMVTVIAFVTGIRAQRNPDGSTDLTAQVTRFDVLGENQFVQYVERVVYVWDRTRNGVREIEYDRTDGLGEQYAPSLEAAEQKCEIFINSLDFEMNFDPAAWV